MLSREKQEIQELLAHPGWETFRSLVFTDQTEGGRIIRQSLKGKLLADLQAAGRAGDGIKSARVTGQLDILEVVFDVLPKYLKS